MLFMDEPTTGLEPQSRANLWQHIRGLFDGDGGTVFLTTHYREEADALCDRSLVVDDGVTVAVGTPAELNGLSNAQCVGRQRRADALLPGLALAAAGLALFTQTPVGAGYLANLR